ncbi:MAG: hypothetical protein Q8830_03975, partial [Candidatus Phytoplasma australasiaticum]|nr:hypothetical protein [Candidatus Phytoplasma australasiaticum]
EGQYHNALFDARATALIFLEMLEQLEAQKIFNFYDLQGSLDILRTIWYGPTYLGLSFPLFPNLITPFIGDTFRNTQSPIWNCNGHRRLSA